jgi:hypothetical protein
MLSRPEMARFRHTALCSLLALLTVLATGCTASRIGGTRTIPADRFDFNEAIIRSWNEQLLLNLVRLRYEDTPLFLDIGNIVTQYAFTGNLGIATTIPGDQVGLSSGLSYSSRPTITYSPLTGEAFAERLLSPISPLVLMMLSQSGWSLEMLLLTCVQEVNDIRNAPNAAADATPSMMPRFRRFQRLSSLLRELQLAGEVELRLIEDQGLQVMYMFIREPDDPDDPIGELVAELRQVLGIRPEVALIRITGAAMKTEPDEVALTSRSLLGVLKFLSHSVEPPPAHIAQGRLAMTRTPEGDLFDWNEVTGPLLQIRSSPTRPTSAFASVHYRGFWFYIDDAEIRSKTTFGLLTYLFSLQSVGPDPFGPILTLPADR